MNIAFSHICPSLSFLVSLKVQHTKKIYVYFFQENLEGLIEIHGIGQGRQVMCQSYVSFPMEYASTFGEHGDFVCGKDLIYWQCVWSA